MFTRNRDIVIAHNTLLGVSFHLGFNMMSDWTEEEYKSILTNQIEEHFADDGFDASANTALPNAVNWVPLALLPLLRTREDAALLGLLRDLSDGVCAQNSFRL
jgi:hypothetical protein